jgi:hypothetical protein
VLSFHMPAQANTGRPITLIQVRHLAPFSPSASQKPVSGMMQRCSGLGATNRHMKLVRSAMLLIGFGFDRLARLLALLGEREPPGHALKDARAILLPDHHAGTAGIDLPADTFACCLMVAPKAAAISSALLRVV